MNKGLMVGIIALLLAGGVYMYSSRKAAPTKDAPTKDADVVVEEVDYTLDLQNFSYTPNVIQGKAGETLKVKIVNVGGFHNFVIDELGVASKQIAEGESEIVEILIPADATGEYEFYCSVGNHRAQGMVGILMIVE